MSKSEFNDYVRYGYCTTTFSSETKCPHCNESKKRLHQPIKYLPDYQVCASCFDRVCKLIEKTGFDRHGNSSDFDVLTISPIRNI